MQAIHSHLVAAIKVAVSGEAVEKPSYVRVTAKSGRTAAYVHYPSSRNISTHVPRIGRPGYDVIRCSSFADVADVVSAAVAYIETMEEPAEAKLARAQAQEREVRLADLDARWERFVNEVAAAMFVHPDAKREQLRRNQENGKAKRKHARAVAASSRRGFGATRSGLVLLPTVKEDSRRSAERYALNWISQNAETAGRSAASELAEAEELRGAVEAANEPAWMAA